jgi:hypothetical protein
VSGREIYHSVGWGGGRHWLTIASEPPLQVGPVAPNHCRIGLAILRAVCDALDRLEAGAEIPDQLGLEVLPRGRVLVDLPLAPARWQEIGQVPPDDEDETQFLTPMPAGEWSGSYDEWLYDLASRLGLEPPPAADEAGYEREMDAAHEELQSRLPGLRERYLRGLDGLSLAFKVALKTASGGVEWCWVLPRSWDDPQTLVATLESAPHDVPDRKEGDELRIAAEDLVDYIIGSEGTGTVEAGHTHRIAEDYGVVLQ